MSHANGIDVTPRNLLDPLEPRAAGSPRPRDTGLASVRFLERLPDRCGDASPLRAHTLGQYHDRTTPPRTGQARPHGPRAPSGRHDCIELRGAALVESAAGLVRLEQQSPHV